MTPPRTRALRTTPFSVRLVAAFLVLFATALAAAAAARAEIVTSRDSEGRTITFDVLAEGVDVEWYASILRNAAHGDEISRVTIRIVPARSIRTYCGAGAVACYGARGLSGTMHVPAGADDDVARTFLHEYGHHIDHARPGVVGREPNGTSGWWAARGMQELLDRNLIAFDYSLGWSRSVAEVFAEDYAYIHLPGGYAIPWLAPPDEALKAVLIADVNGTPPTTPTPAPPALRPVVINRRGVLAARRTTAVPFGLLGPGRRITFTATVNRPALAGTRARIDVVCDGRRIGTAAFTKGRSARTIDLRRRGPGDCQARLVSTTRTALTYTLRVRLAVESST